MPRIIKRPGKVTDMDVMRAGRSLSQVPESLCTLYRVTGEDWQDHECIGIVKSPEIAAAVCEAVNAQGIPLP
jgi:hypothetical protein